METLKTCSGEKISSVSDWVKNQIKQEEIDKYLENNHDFMCSSGCAIRTNHVVHGHSVRDRKFTARCYRGDRRYERVAEKA